MSEEVLLKEILSKEYKDKILAVGVLPAPKEDPMFRKFYEENIPDEIKERFKESFERKHFLIIVYDYDIEEPMKKLELKAKVEGEAIQIVKEKNLELWIDTFLLSEINQMAMESHFEIFDTIARVKELYDPKEYIKIIRTVLLHRDLVIGKFERYVVAYVMAGSYTRGTASPKSDVDVYVVIDDTDVRKHTFWELKQKLISIVYALAVEAQARTGLKRTLHPQVYTLTEFWKALKEVNPVIITFLRDGIPIYDRGLFVPWKRLLIKGEIKPTDEATEAYIKDSKNLLEKVEGDIKELFLKGIYWSIITAAQAAVMADGRMPPAPKEASSVMRELFVNKYNLLEEEYIKILDDAVRLNKAFEHGEVKEFKGKDVDEWISKAKKFVSRMERLIGQIRQIKLRSRISKAFEEVILRSLDLLKALGMEVTRESIKEKLEEAYRKGAIPIQIYEIFNSINEKINLFRSGKEGNVEELIKLINEYMYETGKILDRIITEKIIKRRIQLKVGNSIYDMYVFDNNILLRGEKLYDLKIENGKVVEVEEISKEEMERRLREYSTKNPTSLTNEIMDRIKELIGEFEIIF